MAQAKPKEEREYYEGIKDGKPVRFPRKWNVHRFTDEECEALLRGESVSFTAVKKDGKKFRAKGGLSESEYHGKKHYAFKLGFQPGKQQDSPLRPEEDALFEGDPIGNPGPEPDPEPQVPGTRKVYRNGVGRPDLDASDAVEDAGPEEDPGVSASVSGLQKLKYGVGAVGKGAMGVGAIGALAAGAGAASFAVKSHDGIEGLIDNLSGELMDVLSEKPVPRPVRNPNRNQQPRRLPPLPPGSNGKQGEPELE